MQLETNVYWDVTVASLIEIISITASVERIVLSLRSDPGDMGQRGLLP